MEKTKSDYKLHVFVCTNTKKKGDGCGPLGADELRAKLKDWAKENPDWRKKIRINSAGCLDRCSEGIAVVMYPHEEWFVEVRKRDFEALQAEITRLMNEP